MTPDYKLCDVKNCREKTNHSIRGIIDRKMDGAGSMENIQENIDICPFHLASALQKILRNMSYEEVKTFMLHWKG